MSSTPPTPTGTTRGATVGRSLIVIGGALAALSSWLNWGAKTRQLGAREGLERKLRERIAAPEAERLPQQVGPLGRFELLGRGDQALEPSEVEQFRIDGEDVARRPGEQELGPDQFAEVRDRVLERRGRGLRRSLAPEPVHEPVGREHLSGMQKQQREESALLLRRDRSDVAVRDDFERPEDPEVKH